MKATKGETVLLDLTDLQFIDSTGIRVVTLAWKRAPRDASNCD